MSKTPTYPSLPQITDDPDSLRGWIAAADQTIKTLTGQVGTQGQANQTFTTSQSSLPITPPVGDNDGDMWVQLPVLSTQKVILSVWKNGAWVQIAAANLA